MLHVEKIRALVREAEEHIENVSVCCFGGMTNPLFLIANAYPGVWLEHLYDSVLYAKMYPGRNDCMVNFIDLWMEKQAADGQLPCYVRQSNEGGCDVGYGQIQECVSFGKMCLLAHEILRDEAYLQKMYAACEKWVGWLESKRMTLGRGLIEMFYGYDTGHDNSGRLKGMACIGNHMEDGKILNAGVLPPDDGVSPIIAVDMNCNFYGNLIALSKMAEILGNGMAETWKMRASEVKRALFAVCFDKDDAFFYDVDRSGSMRRIRSSTILHLFLEGVLDREEDKDLIAEILERHLLNPDEFWTAYPFPAVAVNDPATEGHADRNCWGYFSQALIALRCSLWMDEYGLGKEFDHLCAQWLTACTEHSGEIKFGQELDPITGVPSPCANFYSAGMLFYIYAARRLKII